ncbi:hypothetical protein Glove_329g63 [Diversispora epigaea]|uniref:Uncharacterized protein n=1 Tax=Diversispora epigaea TaxID=1348612 RepID=A0A397HQQ2_9GLOM|nr:hypothetical protein Glove_329g63 [Diversispora epigaea]
MEKKNIPTINISDNNNNNNNNNNNSDNNDNNLREYNSIIENNIQQNNLYNDDDNWNGIISNLSASPSNSMSDFTSNASSSPSIASPLIISSDTPTSTLASSNFMGFTDFTTIINNTAPIITQNNYEIMDFPSIIYNSDTIMQPLIMMQ